MEKTGCLRDGRRADLLTLCTAVPFDAGVRLIKFHGLRHTAITLMLGANVPVHVVAQRVGHAKATMTLEVYSHALPDMQRGAASRLAAVLRG